MSQPARVALRSAGVRAFPATDWEAAVSVVAGLIARLDEADRALRMERTQRYAAENALQIERTSRGALLEEIALLRSRP